MRAIVTGGAGFIGSNLVDALVDARRRGDGRSTTSRPAARRTSTGRSSAARSWSCSTSATPPTSTARSRAARPRGRPPPRRADRRAQVDRRPRPGTRRSTSAGRSTCCAAALAHGVGRVVNSSTGGAIYGDAEHDPVHRDARRRCRRRPTARASSPPRATSASTSACYGLDAVTLRYGNVYGPRQDPLGEAGVIAIFCGKLDDGEHADGLRRRPPDARLRLRRRRRRRRTSRRPPRRARGAVNIGTGSRDERPRARRDAARAGRARATSSRSSRPLASASSRAAASTSPRARRLLGWSPTRLDARRAAPDARRGARGSRAAVSAGAPRALITGIAGQDGSYLAELLCAEGVRGPRRRARPRRGGAEPRRRSRRCCTSPTCTTPGALAAIVAAVAPDEIYHLAAPTFVPDSWADPQAHDARDRRAGRAS